MPLADASLRRSVEAQLYRHSSTAVTIAFMCLADGNQVFGEMKAAVEEL